MFFDFSKCENPIPLEDIKLDTIFYINGDETYVTPRKPVTEGKTYFLYTVKGKGVVNYDGNMFLVNSDTFIFMQPHRDFSYWCKDDKWEFWWFEFNGDCRWEPDKLFSLPCDHLSSTLMTASLRYAKLGEWELASTLFLALARHLIHNSTQPKKLADNERITSAAEEYIVQHIDSVTVQELAEALGVTDRTLRNIYYTVADMSPKRYITQLRMNMAGYMLTSSEASLDEIAQRLGFSSRYHLGKIFKEHFGVTPIKYRRLIYAGG